ncbi:MAG: serine/threonine protein kinase, partial [Candidatus Aminicenantia bacterium]
MVSIKKLGKYEIAKPLGSGGMGSVYLGKDPIIGRFVAIKVLNIEAEGELEKSDVESFFNEAKVAGTLIHPNIVTIFDAGIEEGIPFIVMEFFDGVPLSRFIETRELSAKEKLEILKKIGDAIDFAHSKGVIHRDIKPANILINDNKEVKIADFGIARILSSHKLKQSVAIGTPAYIAPEQAIGDAIDQRADIFSFAVVAYELLSGVLPFLGNDYNSTLYNILYAEPREPRNLREAGIDEKKWKQVFDRALSKRPEKRFSTAKDLVSALEEVLLKDRALKPLKKAEDDQVITRTLTLSRKKFKFYI